MIGKGPMDKELREFFKGFPVFFAGQLVGTLKHQDAIDILIVYFHYHFTTTLLLFYYTFFR